MKPKMSLDNIEEFSIPLSEHPCKWLFEDEEENLTLSPEFEDQIIALSPEAAKFVWNFEGSQRYIGPTDNIKKYFKQYERFPFGANEEKEVKKWLYQRGIPFDRKVFYISQPDTGFVLTWKMVIKFASALFFGSDEIVWDRTLNWVVAFHHDDVFYFGKDRTYNSNERAAEMEKTEMTLQEALEKAKNQPPTLKYSKNPYLKW